MPNPIHPLLAADVIIGLTKTPAFHHAQTLVGKKYRETGQMAQLRDYPAQIAGTSNKFVMH